MLVASDPAGALKEFREAVVRNPFSMRGRYNQALVLAEYLKQPRQAVQVLDELIRLFPHLPVPRGSRGVLRARLGERQAGVGLLLRQSNDPSPVGAISRSRSLLLPHLRGFEGYLRAHSCDPACAGIESPARLLRLDGPSSSAA
jgi:hypothetical protein